MCPSNPVAGPTPIPPDASSQPQDGCATSPANIGRVVEPSHDLDFPEVPFPSRRVLETVGETALRKLVRRHHERLRKSEIGYMFPKDNDEFAAAVSKIADFVIESCGGAAEYTRTEGRGCMRTRHFPFVIDEASREVWLICLWLALEESDFPDPIRKEYWSWMEPFSIRMINRRTQRGQPERFPFASIQVNHRSSVFAVCPR